MPKVEKQRIERKTKSRQLVFDSFFAYNENGKNALPVFRARNCDCSDGTISNGIGFVPYLTTNGTSVESDLMMQAFHVVRIKDASLSGKAREELYAVDVSGYLHKYSSSVGKFVGINSNFPAKKILTIWQEGVGTLLFFIMPNKICVQKNEEGAMQQLFGANRAQACICKNRLFYAQGNSNIAYVDPLDPAIWTTSLEGYGVLYADEDDKLIQGMVTLGDSVIVLYENALKKITVAGSPQDFVVEDVVYSGGQIYYNTACTCGNAVFFLAEDGVYRYDGSTVQRACENMPIHPAADTEIFSSACCYDEYMLSYDDTEWGASTLVVKNDGKSGYFSDSVICLSGDGTRAIAQCGKVVGVYKRGASFPATPGYYVINFLELGSKGNKIIKKITLYGEGELYMTLIKEKGTRKVKLTFENGVAEWIAMEKAEKFAFQFQFSKPTRIAKMVLDVVYC